MVSRFVLAGMVLLLIVRATPVFAGASFSISGSDVFPALNESSPTNGVRMVHLWLTCSEEGLSALSASVSSNLSVLSFQCGDGVINVGTATNLLLAISGCPMGNPSERLLGNWLVLDNGGDICLAPTAGEIGILMTDCDSNPNTLIDPFVVGFSTDGSVPTYGPNGCPPPSPASSDISYYAVCHKRDVIQNFMSGAKKHWKFYGVEGDLNYVGDIPEPATGGDTSVWVGLGICGTVGVDQGWIQVGVGRLHAAQTKVFWQTKLPTSNDPRVHFDVPLDRLPVPGAGKQYKVSYGPGNSSGDGNCSFTVDTNNLLEEPFNQGAPTPHSYQGITFCSLQAGAETHSTSDTLPGTLSHPWSFTGLTEWVHDVLHQPPFNTDSRTPDVWEGKYDRFSTGHPNADVQCASGSATWYHYVQQ